MARSSGRTAPMTVVGPLGAAPPKQTPPSPTSLAHWVAFCQSAIGRPNKKPDITTMAGAGRKRNGSFGASGAENLPFVRPEPFGRPTRSLRSE